MSPAEGAGCPEGWKRARAVGEPPVCVHTPRALPVCPRMVPAGSFWLPGCPWGATLCTLAAFLMLAFPEGGLLVDTPARCTKQVAGLVCVFTCSELLASALRTCASAGMPGAFKSWPLSSG